MQWQFWVNLIFEFVFIHFKTHKAECPSRANFDRFICSVSSSGSGPAQPEKEEQRQPARPRQMMVQQNNDDEEENWDHVRFTQFIRSISSSSHFSWPNESFSSFHFQYDTPTYDPKQYAMNAKVLRMPQGMTPSQRRQFADAERKRLSHLNQSRSGQHLPR